MCYSVRSCTVKYFYSPRFFSWFKLTTKSAKIRTLPNFFWSLYYLSFFGFRLVFSGVCVGRSLVVCLMFGKSLFVVLSIFFSVVVSSISQFTSSDYTFAIFKLVLFTSKSDRHVITEMLLKVPLSTINQPPTNQ
jgi:hypothetical protein